MPALAGRHLCAALAAAFAGQVRLCVAVAAVHPGTAAKRAASGAAAVEPLDLARDAAMLEDQLLYGEGEAAILPQLVEVESGSHAALAEVEQVPQSAAGVAHSRSPAGAASMMRREADRDAAAASWSPRQTISSNVLDLDGTWTTATGRNNIISGNTVTQPTGKKTDIVIKEGGRRVEMQVAGTNYWGLVVGRGTLNWNDGDVWTRKVDCQWQDWSEFGACAGPCGKGKQQRQRGYAYVQENGGAPCEGPTLDCFATSYCDWPKGANGGKDTKGKPGTAVTMNKVDPATAGTDNTTDADGNATNLSDKSGALGARPVGLRLAGCALAAVLPVLAAYA